MDAIAIYTFFTNNILEVKIKHMNNVSKEKEHYVQIRRLCVEEKEHYIQIRNASEFIV